MHIVLIHFDLKRKTCAQRSRHHHTLSGSFFHAVLTHFAQTEVTNIRRKKKVSAQQKCGGPFGGVLGAGCPAIEFKLGVCYCLEALN